MLPHGSLTWCKTYPNTTWIHYSLSSKKPLVWLNQCEIRVDDIWIKRFVMMLMGLVDRICTMCYIDLLFWCNCLAVNWRLLCNFTPRRSNATSSPCHQPRDRVARNWDFAKWCFRNLHWGHCCSVSAPNKSNLNFWPYVHHIFLIYIHGFAIHQCLILLCFVDVSENAGLIGLTRVGSRRVIQIAAAFMIFFSLFGEHHMWSCRCYCDYIKLLKCII